MLDENQEVGIPWWSSGYDSTLSPPRAWVQSLVGKLRSHKPQSAVNKKKEKVRRHVPISKHKKDNGIKFLLLLYS